METENKQEKKWLALLLSFLVCVGGAVIWGLLYTFGWFATIVAFATAFCAGLVYEKVNKKVTKSTHVWVLVWVITLNIIASFLAVIILFITYGATFGEAVQATFNILKDTEVLVDFLFDMILGVVFSVLGVVTYYQYKKRATQAKEEEIQNILLETRQILETKTDENEVEEQPKTEVLRCSQCGGRLKENSTTCEYCGKRN